MSLTKKPKPELHPLGEGTFQIIKVFPCPGRITLILSPLLKGKKAILRSYFFSKPQDILEIQRLGCMSTAAYEIEKFFKSLTGATVCAEVTTARNPEHRNIESFCIVSLGEQRIEA